MAIITIEENKHYTLKKGKQSIRITEEELLDLYYEINEIILNSEELWR